MTLIREIERRNDMAEHKKITKEEVLSQLKKEGVTDLNGFADFLVNKATKNNPGGPVVLGTIIYSHGFVTH
jgi:hypothetical protein